MRMAILFVTILLALAAPSFAQEDQSVGLVKTASGDVSILRDGRSIPAHPGTLLVLHDQLVTGKGGSLGVILCDDTVLSLGPLSKVRIQEFAYEPHRGRLGMVLKVTRGLIEYLSGKIAKLAPGSVRIETPVATLGIRGTHLLARIDS